MVVRSFDVTNYRLRLDHSVVDYFHLRFLSLLSLPKVNFVKSDIHPTLFQAFLQLEVKIFAKQVRDGHHPRGKAKLFRFAMTVNKGQIILHNIEQKVHNSRKQIVEPNPRKKNDSLVHLVFEICTIKII